MSILFGTVAVIVAVYWFNMFMIHRQGLKRVPRLPVFREPLKEEPLLSIIIASKDEEGSITQTINSLLKQSCQNIDHRGQRPFNGPDSRFGTTVQERGFQSQSDPYRSSPGRVARQKPCHVHRISAPAGDTLLFTDADVQFLPDTICSAHAYIKQQQANHISLIPYFIARSFWLRGFVHFFGATLYLSHWPWKPNDDRQTTNGIGIGAFMLLTREAYQQIGTHRKLSFRPDDDLQLGIRVKQKGLKQRYMIGTDHIRVEWYPTLPAALKGLEKNIFAGLHYSVPMLIYVWIAMLLFHVYPFIGVWFTGVWQQVMLAAAILFLLGCYGLYTRKVFNDPAYDLLLLPVFALLYLYALTRSCLLTLARGGIYWRGTFYRLDDLKNRR